MLKLVSMGSKSRGLETYVRENADCEFLRDTHFAQSDVVTTMITCADGSLITLKLDTTLPRAYSREFTVSGTKGIFSVPDDVVLTDDMEFNHGEEMEKYRTSEKVILVFFGIKLSDGAKSKVKRWCFTHAWPSDQYHV